VEPYVKRRRTAEETETQNWVSDFLWVKERRCGLGPVRSISEEEVGKGRAAKLPAVAILINLPAVAGLRTSGARGVSVRADLAG
jgi:hypothetical protein